jgi:hypothetical protein
MLICQCVKIIFTYAYYTHILYYRKHTNMVVFTNLSESYQNYNTIVCIIKSMLVDMMIVYNTSTIQIVRYVFSKSVDVLKLVPHI